MVKTLLVDIDCETDDNTCGECEELSLRECPKCHVFREDLEEGLGRKPLRCDECKKSEEAATDLINHAAKVLIRQGYIKKGEEKGD